MAELYADIELSKVLENGAILTSSGILAYPFIMEEFPDLSEDHKNEIKNGRITKAGPEEIHHPDINMTYPPVMHIIPPHSAEKLVYEKGERPIDTPVLSLLHGVNNEGKPIKDDLTGNHAYQLMLALRTVAMQGLNARGINTNEISHKPLTLTKYALIEIAKAKGMGRIEDAMKNYSDKLSA